jgi:ankyrin repeat protein
LIKAVKYLLSKGADVNAQGGRYSSALQVASSGGHEKIVELLLGRGADVDAQGEWHGSALYAALSRGLEKIVEVLLGRGSDVDAQGGEQKDFVLILGYMGGASAWCNIVSTVQPFTNLQRIWKSDVARTPSTYTCIEWEKVIVSLKTEVVMETNIYVVDMVAHLEDKRPLRLC